MPRSRVVQNRISAPYMTVCMVTSLLKILYLHVYTYKCMVLANPTQVVSVGPQAALYPFDTLH